MDFFDFFINVPENIVIVSPEFKILAATDTYLKTTMKTREDILGKTFLKEVYQNPDVSFEENPVILSIERAIATKKIDYLDVLRYDLEKSEEDGGGYETRYWEASHTPVLDEHQNVRYVIQNTHDVTEREQARKAMKVSEGKFKFLTDAVPQLIHTNDPDGSCNYVNQRWLEYTGLTYDQLMGMQWLDTIHPEDLPSLNQRRQQAIAAQEEYQMEARIRSKDGQYRWHLLKSIPMREETGEVVMRVGSVMDIHNTKIMVQEMLEANEQLSTLSDQLQLAYQQAEDQRVTMEHLIMQAPALFATLKGPEHVFTLVNFHYQNLFPKRELKGKTIKEALPEVIEQGFVQLLDNVFETGIPFVAEEIGVALDRDNNGQLVDAFFNIIYQPLYETGKVAGIIVFGYEVTDKVSLRKELETYKARP
ncbi:PAS domain-containing protein [Nibribacter ruber]|uniref:histidine kinase n=1 Tax=Nibribacter ruber TaxID=2698458 RepID=A0A6P1P2G9_9BACT|nr:PAS domain-containing protein [Nibribacter ruber]QHL88588.1 PAS domain-containing protein [Nibribacter ruber]